MKKIISIPVYVLITVLCSVFVVSCSEDSPVTPPISEGPYQFDSARYDWETLLINSTTAFDIFGFDTSQVYILEFSAINIFDGKNFTRHLHGDMAFFAIDGSDQNNIYICGSYTPDLGKGITKWNGSSYEDIYPPPDSTQDNFYSIFVKSSNEIWLGSKGKIYLYDGVNFTKYMIDPDFVVEQITEDQGRLLAVGKKRVCDSVKIDCSNWLNTYSNTAGYWSLINTIYWNSLDTTQQGYRPFITSENQMFLYSDYEIKKLSMNEYSTIAELPVEVYWIAFSGGRNESDITSKCFSRNGSGVYLYNWNGLKWSKEFKAQGLSSRSIKKIGDNYYSLEEATYYLRVLSIGKKKSF